MLPRRLAAVVPLALLTHAVVLPARAAPAAAPPADAQRALHPQTIHAVFACEGGKTIDALFTVGAEGGVQLILSDGRHLALPQARSASGARYANGDESFVFWNKGDTGFVEERGKTTFSGCAARK